MYREKRDELIEKAAQRLGIPIEESAGIPAVRIVGRGKVHIENHRGLIGYGTEEITLNAGRMVIRLTGSGLELRDMTDLELVITGKLDKIEYLE